MAYKTLQAFSLRDLWPASWGAGGTLVIGLKRALVSVEDGKTFPATENLGAGSLRSLGFHWESEITVTSGRAATASISGLPVTDRGVLPPNFSPYLVYIFDETGTRFVALTSHGFHLRDAMDDVFTWLAWETANQFRERKPTTQFIGDYDRVQAMIDDVLPAPLASNLVAGLVVTDVPPVDPSRPEVVGTNSPLLDGLVYEDDSRLPLSGVATISLGSAVVNSPLASEDMHVLVTSRSPNVTGTLYCDPTEVTPSVAFVIRTTNFGDAGDVTWAILQNF